MQFVQRGLLSAEVCCDGLGHGSFSDIGRRDPDGPYQGVPGGGRFKDNDSNMMCQQPPWGELTAVNVNTGEFAWRVPLGITESLPPEGALDASVDLFSAPGEMQECVEIARRIQAEVKRGVPFDKIAVLLHAPIRYAPYLEEALDRAGIPAYFARGTARPEPKAAFEAGKKVVACSFVGR